jgi:hypothetical protein
MNLDKNFVFFYMDLYITIYYHLAIKIVFLCRFYVKMNKFKKNETIIYLDLILIFFLLCKIYYCFNLVINLKKEIYKELFILQSGLNLKIRCIIFLSTKLAACLVHI